MKNRVKTKEQCVATVVLLGENWFYGDKTHVFFDYGAPRYLQKVKNPKAYCADTWEPLTQTQVRERFKESNG